MKTKVWPVASHGKQLFKNLPGSTLAGFFDPDPDPVTLPARLRFFLLNNRADGKIALNAYNTGHAG